MQAIALGLLSWLGVTLGFAYAYFAGLAAIAALFAYQQVLIRDRQRDACFRAFGNNVWVGFALFAGIALEYSGRAAFL